MMEVHLDQVHCLEQNTAASTSAVASSSFLSISKCSSSTAIYCESSNTCHEIARKGMCNVLLVNLSTFI